VVDTFHDRRNAFYFRVGPAGSKGDALVARDGQSFNLAWDGIWEGHTAIDADGWTAELAIPFQTLAFDPRNDTWGFNLARTIKRRLETDRWSGLSRDQSLLQVSAAGSIAGFAGLAQGVGLDVVPFYSARLQSDSRTDDTSLVGKPGVDAFYHITPSLQASLTVNTDFADTEVDDRRVNLTRFPLFFPEKRAFFLQDAPVFEFADLDETLVPFFSRRIGLSPTGEPVPILVGGKITGHQDDWNVGALDVETDAKDAIPRQNLFAARISRNIGPQSTIGAIFTSGDPTGAADNQLLGLDANFRTDSFWGDKNLTASLWGLKTETGGVHGDDAAFGASVGYPNDLWSWKLSAREIQAGFSPALGFVERTGVREYAGQVAFEPRIDREIRRLEFSLQVQAVTGTDGALQTLTSDAKLLGLVWDAGDELRLILRQSRDVLDVPFAIHPPVSIPAGTYDAVRCRVETESALKRPVSGALAVEAGPFFDGDRLEVDASIAWRPSPHFHTGLEYEGNEVDLPAGRFTTHVGRMHADLFASPDIAWQNFVQYDNESRLLGVNSRFRWTLAPGRDLFVDLNETVAAGGGSFASQQQVLAAKFGYTFRF
jgi:hypothetical protein